MISFQPNFKEEGVMSGHSKWSSIKRKKGALDAKRGKIFSRLSKEITTAARLGGGDVDANPRLRTVIQAAKAENMPKDNLERAIKKGTGELPGVQYEDLVFEGYGTGGAAILVECMTDNKNRTTPEIKSIFAKSGGSLASPGSVAWIFESKAYFEVDKSSISEDDLFALVIDAGAQDLKTTESVYEITAEPGDFEVIRQALESNKIATLEASLTKIPKDVVEVTDPSKAKSILRLMDSLEDHDDVQNLYSNFDIPEDLI